MGSSSFQSRRDRLLPLTLMFLIIITGGFALRLNGLRTRQLSWDEIALWYEALSTKLQPQNAPLTSYLLGQVFKLSESATPYTFYLFQVAIGTIAILIAFLWTRWCTTPRVALLAALLVALSPINIVYSQSGLSYACLIVVSGLLHLSFLKAYRDGHFADWAMYCVFLCLALLTHLLTIPLLIAQAIFLNIVLGAPQVFSTDGEFSWRQVRFFALFSIVGSSIGLIWCLSRPNLSDLMQGPAAGGTCAFFKTALSGLSPAINYSNGCAFVVWDLLTLVPLFFAAYGIRALWITRERDMSAYLFYILAVPLVLTYFTLGSRTELDWLRYVSHLSLPYLVAVAVGLSHMLYVTPGKLKRNIIVVVFSLSLLPGLVSQLKGNSMQTSSTSYATLGHFITHYSNKLDGVIFPAPRGKDETRIDYLPNLFQLYSNTKLPGYYLGPDSLRQVRAIPSNWNLTKIATINSGITSSLKAGVYAVFSYENTSGCEQLNRDFIDNRFSTLGKPLQDNGQGVRPAICTVE